MCEDDYEEKLVANGLGKLDADTFKQDNFFMSACDGKKQIVCCDFYPRKMAHWVLSRCILYSRDTQFTISFMKSDDKGFQRRRREKCHKTRKTYKGQYSF